MPFIKVNNTNLWYETHGTGEETLLFCHSLFFSCRMFDHQIRFFSKKYRVVVYDHRGQGRSEVPSDRFDLETLFHDLRLVLAKLGQGPVHLVGQGIGGMVAMRVAARHPELVRSLTLSNTSAGPQENQKEYRQLNDVVSAFGMKAVIGKLMPLLFGYTFLKDNTRTRERNAWNTELQHLPKTITRAVQGAIERDPFLEDLTQIKAPTLVIAGEEDRMNLPHHAQAICEKLPGSRLKVIKNSGHTSTVEQPSSVNRALQDFLTSLR